MMFMVKLAAGLALILFGVRFLRKGLDRLFGGRLLVWLEKSTRHGVQAMCAGAVVGVLAPTSTGLSLLTAQILGNGRNKTEMMLAVLLGANVGMTVLANIAALQVGGYAGFLLLLGVIGFQFLTSERLRGIGQCVLSLGFIFLAMNFLNEAAVDFSRSHDVSTIFGILDQYPFILAVAAAAMAVLLQSSTATVGLGIGLANSGVLPHSSFVVWIMGTNLGLGCTSLMVSRNNVEGRRLGVANLAAKLAVSLLIMALVPLKTFAGLMAGWPVPQQLAVLHTAFNLLVALLFLPLLGGLLLIVKRTLVPDPAFTGDAPRSFLDPLALETPSIALAHATREVLRMTDAVKVMLTHLWAARANDRRGLLKNIQAQDDTVDHIHEQLVLYLSQMGEMNNSDHKWHFTLLSYASELEAIGDIIEKNLAGTVAKQLADGFVLSLEEEAVLNKLYQRTVQQFDLAIGFLTNRELADVKRIIAARDEINAWCLVQRKSHYELLKPGKEALAGSLCFLDILEGLRRISSHLSITAQSLRTTAPRAKKTRPVPAAEASGVVPSVPPAQASPASGTP